MSIARKIITGDAGAVPSGPSDPDFADVSALIRGNADYYPASLSSPDYSFYKHPITPKNSPVNSNFKPGTNSYSTFCGGSAYLSFNTIGVPAFGLSSSAMTVEAWVYPKTVGSSSCIIRTSNAQNSAKGFALTMNSARQVSFIDYFATTQVVCTTPESIPLNQWTHIAGLFTSQTMRICINGAPPSCMGSARASTYAPAIGKGQVGGGWNGYVFGVHINKKRRYDYVNGFTPSARVPNDTSSNGVITISGGYPGIVRVVNNVGEVGTRGNVKQTDTETNYNPTSISFGAAYSELVIPEGSNEYTFGTDDFTIETWAYLTSSGGVQKVVDYRSRTGNRGLRPTIYVDGGKVNFYNGGVRISSESLSGRTNQWMHIAVCRHSGETKLFIDGIQEGITYIDNTNYLGVEDALHIGGLAGSYNVQGYLDDIRICKNFAVYRGDFTPPTQAFPTN